MNKLEILKCISCGKGSLKLSANKSGLICNSCTHTYVVEGEIPVLIAPDSEEELLLSEVHKRQGSKFDYKEHYKQDALDFDYFQIRDPGTEHTERRIREMILAHLPKNKGEILDVGCGKAWVAENCCADSEDVVSIDLALTNVSKAVKKYPFKNHSGFVADALNLPFKENSFDIIIASEIIEHVVYPDKFVTNLLSILKPGGVLIVTTPYKEKIQYSLCVHCNKLTPRHAHIHSFDENKLKDLCPDDSKVHFSYKLFGNKVLMHLRTHVILRHFSFRIWKFMDSVANFFYKSPATILVKWNKQK